MGGGGGRCSRSRHQVQVPPLEAGKKHHNFPFWHRALGGGGGGEQGLQALSGRGWEEASRPAAGPVHSPEARFCLRRAEINKAWKGPGGPGSKPSR